jgi:protein gp37
MGDTSIEWVRNGEVKGKTWNPLIGCTRCSPGCARCYAEGIAARFSGPGLPYEGVAKMTPSGPRWTGEIKLLPDKLQDPLRWKKPRTVFVNSMSDLFHPNVPFDFVDQVFAVMALTPRHTYQVLTKRPERMAEYLRGHAAGGRHIWTTGQAIKMPGGRHKEATCWPLPNVWLGTSVENREYADKRIPELLKCDAACHFLSCEPLLGPLDLTKALHVNQVRGPEVPWPNGTIHGLADPPKRFAARFEPRISWVIVGCESGTGARPMDEDWVRSLRDQCQAAGVNFFYKQRLNERGHKVSLPELDGKVWNQMPDRTGVPTP